MATPRDSGKTMSSRLLTMKFMQRAAASSPSSAPSTPGGPPSKKQRLSDGSSVPFTPESDARAVEEALAAEEAKRIEALERAGADAGETKWYLSYRQQKAKGEETPLRIVYARSGALDSPSAARMSAEEDDEGSEDEAPAVRPDIIGRRSFGKFNRKVEKQQDLDNASVSSDGSGSSSGSEDDGAATRRQTPKRSAEAAALRAERKAKRRAEQAAALKLGEQRRSKQVKLNTPTGISSGGGSGDSRGTANVQCRNCGKTGHRRVDCDQWKTKNAQGVERKEALFKGKTPGMRNRLNNLLG